ncbi:MAG: DUF1702 family protein [Bacteroidota bacterium]
MSLHNNVAGKMEYIQKVFLSVQGYMQTNHELEELIAFLDTEPPEFRSVAYESASMEIGLQDLSCGNELNNWKHFYRSAAKAHTFHMDIGLGWAFAKKEILPDPYLESLYPVLRWMVFDGIGYYHGLFNGRRTVKNQLVPDKINVRDLHGFDQGLGRRLWYISKGEVEEAVDLIQKFPLSRHPALWCGVGIACGYVGGNKQTDLELLLSSSGEYSKQLQTGAMFAAISRIASGSVTEDVENACRILCNKTVMEIKCIKKQITDKLFYLYKHKDDGNWLTIFESEFHK